MSDKQTKFDDAERKYEHEKWEYEINRATAERNHNFELDHALRLNEATINNGNLATRALLIINGGAAIAVLAFLGQLVPQSKPGDWLIITPLFESLWWFACGVVVTAIAMGFAYFTNYSHASVSYERDLYYEYPYIRDTDLTRKWLRLGSVSQWLTIIFAVLAIIFFSLGIFEISEIVRTIQQAGQNLPTPVN